MVNVSIDDLTPVQITAIQNRKQKEQERLAEKIQENNPLGVAWVKSTKTEKPIQVVENFEALLQHFSVTIRYNEMSKNVEIDIPGLVVHEDTELNTKMIQLESMAAEANFAQVGSKTIPNFVELVASKNAYHPVRDWIDSREWDGRDRLPLLYNSVVLSEESQTKEVILYKWPLSLVASLYHPGFSCEGVLTFSGTQAQGKTTFVSIFAPQEQVGTQSNNRGKWIRTGMQLDLKSKDSRLEALQHWISELGELGSTFRKTDIEQLKAFVTESTDIIRRPYERKENRYSRRTVFYATINDREFLRDKENRRFWVLNIERFNLPTAEQGWDAQQFWAQMKVMYQTVAPRCATPQLRMINNEYGWFLSPTERQLLAKDQEINKDVDVVVEYLIHSITPKHNMLTGKGQWLNTSKIIEKSGWLGKISNRERTQAADWLRAQGFDYKKNVKAFFVDINSEGFDHSVNDDFDLKVSRKKLDLAQFFGGSDSIG